MGLTLPIFNILGNVPSSITRGINSLVTAKTKSPTVDIVKEESAALTHAIIYCSHSII